MSLSSHIRSYYYTNYDRLSFESQFHFASRLAAWNEDPTAKEYLSTFRDVLVPNKEIAMQQIVDLLNNPPKTHVNASSLRQPYFEKYPDLRGLSLALFRLRHIKYIYGYDLTQDFLSFYPLHKLHQLVEDIEADDDAILTLSTYAINFIYLVRFILYPQGNESSFSTLRNMDTLAKSQTLDSSEKIQLFIYLYTHCIICDTNFYIQPIPQDNSGLYKEIIKKMETLIIENYENIHLDNKFEFLVCCRILGHKVSSSLLTSINDEASRSISDDGTFLIDRYTSFPQSERITLDSSEHRNVLFIMSQSPYNLAIS